MMKKNRGFLDLVVGSLLMAVTICRPWGGGSIQREEQPGEPVAQTAVGQRGEQVFLSNCNGCHPGGGAGVGPALNKQPVPESLVRSRVREGGGPMPAFSPERISDEQLNDLVAYVTALPKSGNGQ